MRLALFQPDIPQNVGACIRLSACFGVDLHVIEPTGFRFDDRAMKRAALDYGPLSHMTRVMKGATPAAVRAQLGRFGFSGDRATARVGTMSGGERARLALALVTREAPHLLILDEPTNHLDVDAREALVRALAGYSGAVVIVSHDRHMIEASADRLVLVDKGRATDFDGTLDDYVSLVLAGEPKAEGASKADRKEERRLAAERREAEKTLKKQAREAESEMERLNVERSKVDRAMFDPSSADAALAKLTMTELMKRRAELTEKIDAAEARWMQASEALEMSAAA